MLQFQERKYKVKFNSLYNQQRTDMSHEQLEIYSYNLQCVMNM